MPAAELRDATTTAWVASRSSGAFCSTWNQAVSPAPMLSLPRTPKLDDGACTSNLDIDGTATDAALLRAVKPSSYFTLPNVGYNVPYTSTLACASARPGAANAPATAIVKSFFCMLAPLWFKPGERAELAPPPTPQSRSPRQCAEFHIAGPRNGVNQGPTCERALQIANSGCCSAAAT